MEQDIGEKFIPVLTNLFLQPINYVLELKKVTQEHHLRERGKEEKYQLNVTTELTNFAIIVAQELCSENDTIIALLSRNILAPDWPFRKIIKLSMGNCVESIAQASNRCMTAGKMSFFK